MKVFFTIFIYVVTGVFSLSFARSFLVHGLCCLFMVSLWHGLNLATSIHQGRPFITPFP